MKQIQPSKHLNQPVDNKATQLKASLRSQAAQFDTETQKILESFSSIKNNFSAIKHAPLEFGARALLAVVQEIPTGPTMPWWLRAVRAVSQEISTGGRKE
jgi:hypothetical protein